MLNNEIRNNRYGEERALYNTVDTRIVDCVFSGPEDGESALKESRNIEVEKCTFELRYPLWHITGFKVNNSSFSETCRAPLWYCKDGRLDNINIKGVKAFRECSNISIDNSNINSEEFCWKCENIDVKNTNIETFYFGLESKNVNFDKVNLKSKYAFQYANDSKIDDSNLETKDCFWHTNNVTIKNSTIKGEYLGWYSNNLTLINCKIIGTQPFCYCNNLKLIDCELVDCDLAFEYSSVEADLKGHVVSIKNPLSGYINVDTVGEIILNHSVYKSECKINLKK